MTQNERLDYLVEEFKTDSVRYKDLTTPSLSAGEDPGKRNRRAQRHSGH